MDSERTLAGHKRKLSVADEKDVLYYFSHRGRADLSILLFAIGEAAVDVRYFDYGTFLQLRDELGAFPLGFVPALALKDGGPTLSESKAIARYAANRVGLVSKELATAALADMFVDQLGEMKTIQLYLPGAADDLILRCRDQLLALCNKFAKVMSQNRFNSHQEEKQEQIEFLSGSFSWADVALYAEVTGLALWDPELSKILEEQHPGIFDIVRYVGEIPAVKALNAGPQWSQGRKWEPTFKMHPGKL